MTAIISILPIVHAVTTLDLAFRVRHPEIQQPGYGHYENWKEDRHTDCVVGLVIFLFCAFGWFVCRRWETGIKICAICIEFGFFGWLVGIMACR
jgi:hypothetical protein